MEFLSFLKMYFKEISGILGAFGMFVLGRASRKQALKQVDTEITGGELKNVESALKLYRVMLDDLQIKLTEAQKAYTLLEERFQFSIKVNKDLEQENIELQRKLEECLKSKL